MILLLVAACAPMGEAPPPSPAPEPTDVAASVDDTWDAVIEIFALDNIPIQTIERASGLIASSTLRVDRALAEEASHCGRYHPGGVDYAEEVTYNVRVRGDEDESSVRVTATWNNPDAHYRCQSTGAWEDRLEQRIKNLAEAS